MTDRKSVVLCILDGWGNGSQSADNAILQANTPNWDRLVGNYPTSSLKTSGLDVGLPDGQMGNSEVGHMNIGSGRIVMQGLPRINKSIEDASLAKNKLLNDLITKVKASGGVCHITGLLSDGGVHAHINHIIEIAKIVAAQNVAVKIHAITDGRDTAPKSSIKFIEECENAIAGQGDIKIVTIDGRYYAMDRDNRWERIGLAYNAIFNAKGETADTALDAVKENHKADVTDEFILPTVIGDYDGVKDGDAFIMANFRADRAREILAPICKSDFAEFNITNKPALSKIIGMVKYSDDLTSCCPALFPSEDVNNTLGDVLADSGCTQLHTAETEKYAHVTFFFNGGKEAMLQGEDRILVKSPDVATYDLQPEMSAPELTDKLVAAINSKKYNFIVVNFANTDMVGHTGSLDAAIKAVETVDNSLGRIEEAVLNSKVRMFITADHGNAEQMADRETGEGHTQHTSNPVPFVLVGNDVSGIKLSDGRLSDIAPTILNQLELEIPAEMTGRVLAS
jgi:2,3-bisphosphoglycerate-independent phosphoglycerate mutase